MLVMDGGSAIVVCHGGVNIEGTLNGYYVRYPASDGSMIELHGVRKVSLSTLTKDEVPTGCKP
jgi:hypothetical protein